VPYFALLKAERKQIKKLAEARSKAAFFVCSRSWTSVFAVLD